MGLLRSWQVFRCNEDQLSFPLPIHYSCSLGVSIIDPHPIFLSHFVEMGLPTAFGSFQQGLVHVQLVCKLAEAHPVVLFGIKPNLCLLCHDGIHSLLHGRMDGMEADNWPFGMCGCCLMNSPSPAPGIVLFCMKQLASADRNLSAQHSICCCRPHSTLCLLA